MCLAVPAKVLSKKGTFAKVDYGNGKARDVNISLVDVKVGEYVIVYAGCAIESMSAKDAKKSLDLWSEVIAKGQEVPQ